MLCSRRKGLRNDQDKRRESDEDGSEVTEPTTVVVPIPEVEAFTGPQVFDEVFECYERGVLEARNRVVEEAAEKYLSEVAKKG